ncbi:MAG: GDP-mannose 4,6-dehydratase [Anaerolineae bacterium]|nr:GDP-mannose 4,6-dehydratase [Anaerolineae bacterium]
MRALITGSDGFAGGHLIRHLQAQAPDLALHGTAWRSIEGRPDLTTQLDSVTVLDLRDPEAVAALIEAVQPDYVYHLAAQAFVPRSFEDPWETLENNIRGQVNLTLALLEHRPDARLLVASSAEIYGVVPPEKMPLTEDLPFAPENPYSVSKVTQDMLALQYHLSHGLATIRTRPFNHIGPGQSAQFVAPAFATQIARIEQGLQEPVIHVGNLEVKRDFTDVRDVVAAYQAAMEKGRPGAAYNICSGNAQSIQALLDTLLGLCSVDVEVRVDPARLRVVDRPIVVGSAARLQADTGWAPQISFEDSLRAVLDEARERVASAQ